MKFSKIFHQLLISIEQVHIKKPGCLTCLENERNIGSPITWCRSLATTPFRKARALQGSSDIT